MFNRRIVQPRAQSSTYGENRLGDIPHSLADISKAKSLLGYDPQFSIAQGLNEAAEWYVENLEV